MFLCAKNIDVVQTTPEVLCWVLDVTFENEPESKVTSVGEDREKSEPLYVAGRGMECCSCCGKQLTAPQTVKPRITIWHKYFIFTYVSKKMKRGIQRNTCTWVFLAVLNIAVHISQKEETTQKYINWWMANQNMVYPYNGISLSHKNEWSTDKCYKVRESQKLHTRWRKLDTQDHIWYDSIDMKYPGQVIP